MTIERIRIWRRRLLLVGVAVWVVLAFFWYYRAEGPLAGFDLLTLVVALLPLMLVYEAWTMLADRVRARRSKASQDA